MEICVSPCKPKQVTLSKNSELTNTCHHVSKFKLNNYYDTNIAQNDKCNAVFPIPREPFMMDFLVYVLFVLLACVFVWLVVVVAAAAVVVVFTFYLLFCIDFCMLGLKNCFIFTVPLIQPAFSCLSAQLRQQN